jgi:NAD-dependent dihydropyrimidine dehydrogenase PreA subunit
MNNVGPCPFEFSKLPPCIVVRTFQWAYLKDFLLDNRKKNTVTDLVVSHNIDCIEFKQNYISIKNTNCISCMFCVFGCPSNYIEIQQNFELVAMCSNFKVDYKNKISDNQLDSYFKGKFLALPIVTFSHLKVKYKDFKSFTEVDETKNISVWGANTIKFLSKYDNNRIGLEIKMNIQNRDRGGRLDICLLSENYLIVAEAKISFKKMMQESRYLSQMLAYEEEITNTLESLNISTKYYKFLLIGGNETDLLPPSHPNCTSNEGNQATLFYDNLKKHSLFFISANALLNLGILKLFKGNNFAIENILDNISKNGLGLLSAGFVNREEQICPIA